MESMKFCKDLDQSADRVHHLRRYTHTPCATTYPDATRAGTPLKVAQTPFRSPMHSAENVYLHKAPTTSMTSAPGRLVEIFLPVAQRLRKIHAELLGF